MRNSTPKTFKKRHCYCFPFFLDLIEDNVRSRLLFPLATLCLYILIVVSITNVEDTIEEPPSEIQAVLPLSSYYTINTSFAETFPLPRIKAVNSKGPVSGVLIQPLIIDLITQTTSDAPICDKSYRKGFAGSLEFIRFADVCKISKIRYEFSNTTNDKGQTLIDNFTLERAPQGTYSIAFEDNYGTQSDAQMFFLQSEVTNMVCLNKPPLRYELNQAFDNPPQVRLFRNDGSAVANKQVIAFSWPEPRFSGSNKAYQVQAQKYAYLEGNQATTGENGIAIFSDLRIVGSNSEYVYIFFAVDGNLVVNWGIPQTRSAKMLDKDFSFNYPIFLIKKVSKLILNSTWPKTIVEGEKFDPQPEVLVLDALGNPLKGRLVVASIKVMNGDYLPSGYAKYRSGFKNKYLIAPIPGTYNAEFLDPLLGDDLLEISLTDENGYIKFSELQFSTAGPAGEYVISFMSEGVEVETPLINVLTSIDKVLVLDSPPSALSVTSSDFESSFKVHTKVVDANEQGIEGKTPQIRVLNEDGLPLPVGDIGIKLDLQNSKLSPSDGDGHQDLYLTLSYSKNLYTNCILEINYDGIIANTKLFVVENSIRSKNNCGCVQILDYPTILRTDQMFSLKIRVLSEESTPLSQSLVSVGISFETDGPTTMPSGLFPDPRAIPMQKTDASGTVTFSGLVAGRGNKGDMYFQAKTFSVLNEVMRLDIEKVINGAYTGDFNDETLDTLNSYLSEQIDLGNLKACTGDEFKIRFKPKVEEIQIKDYQLSPRMFDDKLVSTRSWNKVALKFYDADKNIVKNRNLNINIQVLQGPSYANQLDINWNDIIVLRGNNNIDDVGEMNLEFMFKSRYVGKFAINFYGDGSFSDAYLFKTEFEAKEIVFDGTIESNFDDKVGSPCGQPLKSFSVTVLNSDKKGLADYYVYAALDYTTEDTALDVTDYDVEKKPYFVVSRHRIEKTSFNGVATFKTLTTIDTKGYACVGFRFYVGEEDNFIRSEVTNRVCFKSTKLIAFKGDSYSKFVSQNNIFQNSPQIQITKSSITPFDNNGVLIFMVAPEKVGSVYVLDPFNEASFYFTNNICVYFKGRAYGKYSNTCTKTLKFIGEKPVSFNIQFRKLKWIQNANMVTFVALFSDPLNINNNKNNSTNIETSNPIRVTNVADSIEIINQPPSVVYVGDVFRVTVLLKIITGSPVVTSAVTVAILPSDEERISETTAFNMINQFANGDTSAASLGSTSKKSKNIKLDPSTIRKVTNRRGYAEFNLVIDTGLPGDYCLIFESGNLKSQKTTVFNVFQKIDNITIQNSIDSKIQIPYDKKLKKLKSYPYKFVNQPALKINYNSDIIDIADKIINIKVYRSLDQKEYQRQMDYLFNSTIQASNYVFNTETVYSSFSSSDQSMNSNPSTILSSLMNAVKNGGKIARTLNQDAENFPIISQRARLDANGWLNFTDLTIKFTKLGKYRLLFQVDGMESPLSDEFEVALPDETFENWALSVFEKILIVSTVILVLLSNTSYHSTLLIAFGLISASVTIGLIHRSQNVLLWIIFVYISMALLLIELSLLVIKILLNKKKQKPLKMIFSIKDEIFAEYTYQLLFKKPSFAWRKRILAKENKQGSISPLETAMDRDAIRKLILDNSRLVSKDLIASKSKKEGEKKDSLKEIPITTEETLKPYSPNLSLKEKTKRILTPFSKEYEKMRVGDCFYYPQRIAATLLLNLISVAYISYFVLNSIKSISESFSGLGPQINDAFNNYMSAILNPIKAGTFSDYKLSEFSEATLMKTRYSLDYLIEEFDRISSVIFIGFNVGASLSFLIYVICFFIFIFRFKSTVMDMRKGIYAFPKQKILIAQSATFLGQNVVNSIFSFILITVIFGLVFTILIHPLFWSLLWENLTYILVILITPIVKVVVKIICLKICLDPLSHIKHPRLYAVFQFVQIYLSIIGGLLSAISRIIIMAVVGLVGIMRLDEPIGPGWFLNIAYLDTFNAGFYSTAMIYHLFNNPIHATFANMMLETWDKNIEKRAYNEPLNNSEANGKRELVLAKFTRKVHLAIFLNKNPSLVKFRKSNIKTTPELNSKNSQISNNKQTPKEKSKKGQDKRPFENELRVLQIDHLEGNPKQS